MWEKAYTAVESSNIQHSQRGRFSMMAVAALFATSMFVKFEPSIFDIAAIAACVLALLSRSVRLQYLSSLVALCFVFLMVRMISLLFPEEITNALRFFGITTYLSVGACVLAGFIAVAGPKSVSGIIYGLYIGTAVSFIAYLCVKIGIDSISDITMAYERTRFRGFFKDPNVLGPVVGSVFICALGGLLRSGRAAKPIHAAVLFMSGILIIASLSRGAWLSLAVALTVFTVLAATALNLRYLISLFVAVALAAICIVAMLVYSGVFPELSESVFERMEEKRYDQDRFTVQAHLLELSWQSFWGHGPGEANRFAEELNAEASDAAHNTYIRLLFENGVLGLASFLALLIATTVVASQALRRPSEAAVYIACGIAILFSVAANAFFVDTLHWRHFWFFVAVVWGLSVWEKRTALRV